VWTGAHDATLGDFLVAANGMTLYAFTKDSVGTTTCYGMCATNWPPYTHIVAEPLVSGAGVTGQVATITRADGSVQVTYNGMPLYFWANDKKSGDTTGQGKGGVWFVQKP
jgi:predicted lipoprotein with Yx(FWY)xxD motif